jgi:CubicO group peptidase (beta-lactamase class C family)
MPNRIWLATLALLIVHGSGALGATTHGDSRNMAVAAAVRAGMEKHAVPGVSVAIFDDYRIVWAKGFGVLRDGGQVQVSPETVFQAASISKPITAIAALRLVEQGNLSLAEPVNAQLKSWKIPETSITQKKAVELKHLLSHHAGLNVHGFQGYAIGEPCPTLLEVLDGKAPANSVAVRTMLRPGYAFKYSGGGYCVVQQLMIDATGKPFPQVMSELVLVPAGMKHSTYEQPLPDSLSSDAAVAHRAKRVPLKGKWHVYPEMAAAGLWTTPSDLSLAAIDVAKSYAGKGGHLLSREMAIQMLTPQNSRFGLGFVVQGEGDRLSFSHGGSNEGYRCQLVAYPARGQGLAIMTNSDTGLQMFASVLRVAGEAFGWPTGQSAEE